MKYKNSDDNRYRVQFMRSTEELMDQLTVKEFISYLEENAEFEDYTVEYIDGKCVKCRAYDLTEENSKLHKEFLVTEDGRVFYWRSLISRIELVDDEPIPKKTLKDRTNEDLVIEYQTTHNEDLFRALLEKNTGLLHIIVMDYRIPKYEIEDLLSESYIALIKAVDNFDPTRGVTFTTALKVFVRQHLNRLYNEVTCQKRYNGMDPASYEELVEIHKDDVRGLDCDRFTQIEVDEYLEGLEAKDRYMVTLLLMGYSLSDCAKAFHVANSSITWRIKRIRKNYTAYSMAV
mgnify:FL=1